jgi:hypothetical protein
MRNPFHVDPDVRAARDDLANYMDTARAIGDYSETPEFVVANQAVIAAEQRAARRRSGGQ